MRTSYSSLTQHRRCPQQWAFQRLDRLERDDDSPQVERTFGTWWHAMRAAEAIQRGRRLGSLRYCPDGLTIHDDLDALSTADPRFGPKNVLAASQVWWKTLSEDTKARYVERLGEPLPRRLLNLFQRWRERFEHETAVERPIAVEVAWEREVADTGVVLHGVVDEVYEDARRSMVVIRDIKAKRALAAATAVDDMMDSQLHLYSWGVAPLIADWLPRVRIGAVAYDRACMVAPQPPALTKSGRLAVRGGEPSISRTDLHTYLAWCTDGVPFEGLKKDGSGAGTYLPEPSIVERLGTPEEQARWFTRTLTPLNSALIRGHLQAAVDTGEDQERTYERYGVTGEAGRNLGAACSWCEFQSLCRARMFGGAGGEYDLAEHGLRQRPPRPSEPADAA